MGRAALNYRCRQLLKLLFIVGVIAFLGVMLMSVSAPLRVLFQQSRSESEPVADRENRIPQLRALVEQQQKESAEAAAAYVPKMMGRIDDLTASAETVLRELPGVVHVEVAVRAEQPTYRIVHLRDWHFVPKDLYAIDLRNATGKPLSDEQVDRMHEELCLEVEAVQLEQMALLRCLIKHHGLRRIFAEGLTENDLPNYRDRIAVLRSMEREQMPMLRRQLEEARELKAKGREGAAPIEQEVKELLWDHQKRLLEIGAAGRLLIAGEIEDVLPLDDAELLEQAKPITPDGRVMFDAVELAARRDGIVRAATAKGPFGLIVLGGAHDLSESVSRLGDGRCEYIRVTTRRFRDFAGEE
jgi:hypothetical protein